MELRYHPVQGYRVSITTGTRLPSKQALYGKIERLRAEIAKCEQQLTEHMSVKASTMRVNT
jgi:hypothetical protein